MFCFLDYVNELFECLISSPRDELKQIRDDLIKEVPEPLHSMLDKEDKDDAQTKYLARKEKEVTICPPTCSGICSFSCTVWLKHARDIERLLPNPLCQ